MVIKSGHFCYLYNYITKAIGLHAGTWLSKEDWLSFVAIFIVTGPVATEMQRRKDEGL